MGSSSHSSHSSRNNGDGSDSPPTSPPAPPTGHMNTNRSVPHASKIPKLSTGSSKAASHSRPQTPADSNTTSMALDWGSSGDWSRVASGIKDPSPQKNARVVEEAALSSEPLGDEHPDPISEEAPFETCGLPTSVSISSAEERLLRDAQATSDSDRLRETVDDESLVSPALGHIDRHAMIPENAFTAVTLSAPSLETSLTTSIGSSQLEEDSDNDRPLSPAPGNPDQHALGQANNSAAASLITTHSGDSPSTTDFTNSDQPEEVSAEELPVSPIITQMDQHDITQADNHTVITLAASSSDETSTDITTSDSPMEVSDEEPIISPASSQRNQHDFRSQGQQASGIVDTQPSDATSFDTSDSDASTAELQPIVIRGPFLNVATREQAVDTGPSPRVILRGLIRDAYLEMMHLTLQHSNFSRNDLVHGLDYAYALWQVAVSKLDFLTMFHENATDMDVKDLRRWMANVDHFNPYTHRPAQVLAVFELLSVEEMRNALAELVQSRRGVENDVNQTCSMLIEYVEAVEKDVRHAAEPIESVADYDRGVKDSIDTPEAFFSGDTAWDAILTSIMLTLIGTLYVCVRD